MTGDWWLEAIAAREGAKPAEVPPGVRRLLVEEARQELVAGVRLTGAEWAALSSVSREAWLAAGKHLAVVEAQRAARAVGPLAVERVAAELDGGEAHDLAIGRAAALALADVAHRSGLETLETLEAVDLVEGELEGAAPEPEVA